MTACGVHHQYLNTSGICCLGSFEELLKSASSGRGGRDGKGRKKGGKKDFINKEPFYMGQGIVNVHVRCVLCLRNPYLVLEDREGYAGLD